MFFTYYQNNSGGRSKGSHYVIIEARDYRDANNLAEDKAEIYFNGCAEGFDCNCCGDRWIPYSFDGFQTMKGTGVPCLYKVPIIAFTDEGVAERAEREISVYYLDGTVKIFNIIKDRFDSAVV